MVKAAKQERGSKSNAVRAHLLENPKARVQDVVDALKKQGIAVSAALVNNIKYTKKKPGRKKGRKRAQTSAPAVTNGNGGTHSSDSISLQALIEAKKVADRLGGVEELQKAAAALAKLRQ